MIKVVIVEDEMNILKSIKYMVDWEKFHAVVAGTAWNGKEGLKLIKDIKPDIVITDVSMPFLDGLEMIESGLQEHQFQTIIISGYSSFDYAKTAIRLGVNDYILKPIDYQELEQCLFNLANNIRDARNIDVASQQLNHSQRFSEIIQYIDDHIGEKLSLANICEEFQLSSTTINSIFKNEVNTTASDYINRRKINKAIELIKTERYLVYEVAEMLGFSNYKYFGKVFKKYTGKNPSEFIFK